MTQEQQDKCRLIIHGASGTAAAVGGGLAQIPGADAALIMPVQIAMIVALGQVFGVKITESAARSVTYATLGTIVGKGLARLLVRRIPIVGNVVGAGIAFGITETLGWTAAHQIAEGTLTS